MPKTATAQQIQKNYRSIFNDVMIKREPVVVLNNNKPEVVIVDLQTFDEMKYAQLNREIDDLGVLLKKAKGEKAKVKLEKDQLRKIVEQYEIDKKSGRLIGAGSLADLLDEDSKNKL